MAVAFGVRLIDARTREQLARASLPEEPFYMAFTNDGAHLVVGGRTSISVHDAATLGSARGPDRAAGVPRADPDQFALTPDGRAVITASDAGELTWWDLLTGQMIRTLDIGPGQGALALSPDGRTVAVGIDESVQLVDVGTGT